jgi:antitoxin MazE
MELILEKEQIILRPIPEPRKGWDNAFQKMHENNDDQLLLDDVFEDENFDEWK